jgi:hypothetical protein
MGWETGRDRRRIVTDMDISDALIDTILAFRKNEGTPTVSVLVLVKEGAYALVPIVHSPEQDVYMAIGILEQAKVDLLASVPTNRPLREPEPEAIAPPPPSKLEAN